MSRDDRSTETPEQRARRKADKSHRSFWRACRYLWPYRFTVAASVACALFVAAAFTGGITAMLPIMQVLLNDQTVQEWADAQIAQERMDVRLSEGGTDLVVVRSDKSDGNAAAAGVPAGAIILPPGDAEVKKRTLAYLADPASTTFTFNDRGTTYTLPLDQVRWYDPFLHRFAGFFPERPVYAIALAFGIIACITTLGNVVRFFQEYLSDRAAILAVNDIRRRLYDHILHTPLAYFGRSGTSDVTSRLVQDSLGLQDGMKTTLGQSVQEPLKAAFAFGLALFFSWKLTLFIVLFAPVMLLIIQTFGKKMRRASRKALESSATMLGQIEATLVGIRVVKAANAERFERRRYSRIMGQLVHNQLRMSRVDAVSAPVMETLTLALVGVVILFASYMVLERHTLSKTAFFTVLIALGGIGESLRRCSKVNNVLQKANAAATRIFEVLDMPVERFRGHGVDAPQPVDRARLRLPPLRRQIAFQGVSFAYPGNKHAAVDNVDLVVPKGRSVAIVGRNGSGKTTLLALLPRFYDATAGRVTIDGVDVRDATLKSLRGQISIVTQDSVIFPGTIAQNIAYGQPLATRSQIEDAARRAFAHDFIVEKPLGYDTPLDGLGGQLSGGQKQRLNIARAILRDAPILILDEATSQVDGESEHLIQQAVEGLMKERTTFVIAHRFSTILSADTIVVMDRGRIVGQGSHDELLKSCDTYQNLYERQLFVPPAATAVGAA